MFVNKVGVEVNSASTELLSYVAGLGTVLAANIVRHRQENGAFSTRKELLQVPRLRAKAFEQCAGFLRIRNSENPLDNSDVHPERYGIVTKIAKDQGVALQELLGSEEIRRRVRLEHYVDDRVGIETLTDIMVELSSPGGTHGKPLRVSALMTPSIPWRILERG